MDLTSLNKCRKEGKFTDFTIFAKGNGFPVHRVLLHHRSEYFKLLFKTDMKEKAKKCSEQKYLTSIGVKRVLDAIYGEDLLIDKATVADVLKVCHLWMLETEVKTCKDFLLKHITIDTCISTRNLAALYSMDDLVTKCDKFIIKRLKEVTDRIELTELGVTAVRALLTECVNEYVSSRNLWDFCVKWSECRKESGKSLLCEAIKSFPMKMSDVKMIRCVVWPNPHIQNCAGCRENVGQKLLSLVAKNCSRIFSSYHRPCDVANIIEDCLFVKKMAKLFVKRSLAKEADNFILKNYRNAFACRGFMDINQEDLIQYARQIGNSCSRAEFTGVMKWLRKSPDREGAFPKLFGDGGEKVSRFICSLRNLRTEDGGWLFEERDCFVFKQLAKKYRCHEVQNAIDSYISQNIDYVSTKLEFAELSFKEVCGYLVSAKTHSRPGQSKEVRFQSLWSAVRVWWDSSPHSMDPIRVHLSQIRRAEDGQFDDEPHLVNLTHNVPYDEEFEEFLRILPFEEASLTFLKTSVLEHLHTKKSTDYVLKIILDRAMKMEKEIAENKLATKAQYVEASLTFLRTSVPEHLYTKKFHRLCAEDHPRSSNEDGESDCELVAAKPNMWNDGEL